MLLMANHCTASCPVANCLDRIISDDDQPDADSDWLEWNLHLWDMIRCRFIQASKINRDLSMSSWGWILATPWSTNPRRRL